MRPQLVCLLLLVTLPVFASAQSPQSQPSSPQNADAKAEVTPEVFRETFDNPSTRWPQTGNCKVDKGKLNVLESCVAPVGTYNYENFEVTVVATLFTGRQYNDPTAISVASDLTTLPTIGVSFRGNQEGNYTLLLSPLTGAREGLYKLFKVVNGRQIEITSWRWDAQVKMRNEIKLRCVGPKIDLYVNAIRIAEFKDETHKQGRISLVFSGGQGSFDDLVIKKLK